MLKNLIRDIVDMDGSLSSVIVGGTIAKQYSCDNNRYMLRFYDNGSFGTLVVVTAYDKHWEYFCPTNDVFVSSLLRKLETQHHRANDVEVEEFLKSSKEENEARMREAVGLGQFLNEFDSKDLREDEILQPSWVQEEIDSINEGK